MHHNIECSKEQGLLVNPSIDFDEKLKAMSTEAWKVNAWLATHF
jgi:hypothetical protein